MSTTTISPSDSRQYEPGDISFTIFSSCLLWFMVPGCGFLYSGGTGTKSALTMLILSFTGISITFLHWWTFGYSLSFGTSHNSFIGNFKHIFLYGIYDAPSPKPASGLPEIAFCLYQGVTATLGPGIIFGIIAERGRILPAFIFILVWTTFVYDFVAYWSLNPNGWASRLGFLDFGGAAPVHVPVAAAALAYSYVLGPVAGGGSKNTRPNNMANFLLGTTLIWFASFGYTSGSAFKANIVAIMAVVTTNLSGSTGALVWSLADYWRTGRISAFGFCMGAICGLVAVVPSAGFVSVSSSVAVGALSTSACYAVSIFKDRLCFDDVMDVVILNGMAGLMGNILVGVFAEKFYGGEEVGEGGWLEGNWIQVPIQLADTLATFSLSFCVSFVTLFGMNKVRLFRLRLNPTEEEIGLDEIELGVKCYSLNKELNEQNNVIITQQMTIKEKPSKSITIITDSVNDTATDLVPHPTNEDNERRLNRNNWMSR